MKSVSRIGDVKGDRWINALIPCIPFSRLAGEGDDDLLFQYIRDLVFPFIKQLDHLELPLSLHPGEGCELARRGEGARQSSKYYNPFRIEVVQA